MQKEVFGIRILCVDQAKTCGWALFENKKLVGHGVYTLGDSKGTYEDILFPARQFVSSLIAQTKAEMVVIEDIQYQSNQQSFKKLAMLMGSLVALFKENETLFDIVPPTRWKGFAGIKGRKREEQKANTVDFVNKKFKLKLLSEDEADAIAMGYYAVNNIETENLE